jgi:hypothetical protein
MRKSGSEEEEEMWAVSSETSESGMPYSENTSETWEAADLGSVAICSFISMCCCLYESLEM